MTSKCGCSDKQFGHPCFDRDSHFKVGRIHLPVAPYCNIKCRFCSRKHDCANENRPGVTSRIITPQQALELVKQTTGENPLIRVAGIAGPGDPLANQATFETLELIDRHLPHLTKCLSTNGLLLPDRLADLVALHLDTLTVTVNALRPQTAAAIYAYVNYQGQHHTGLPAVELLLDQQLKGIAAAVSAGLRVKVNSVLIPGLNDQELPELAVRLKELGVNLMNIIPLIPQADMAGRPPVEETTLNQARRRCESTIAQFRHCRQCRADAIGIPGLEKGSRNCPEGVAN